MLTNVKIRKTKISGLEELKMLFKREFVKDIIVNNYKKLIKTDIKYYLCLTERYACFN